MSTSARRFLTVGAAVVVRYDGVALARGRAGPPWDVDADARHPLTLGDLAELLALSGRPVDERLAEVEPDEARHQRTSTLVGVLEHFDLLVPSLGQEPPAEVAGTTPTAIPAPDQELILASPVVLAIVDDAFRAYSHDGTCLVALSPREVIAASTFAVASTPAAADDEQRNRLRRFALDTDDFADLVARLMSVGLLQDATGALGRENAVIEEFRRGFAADRALRDTYLAAHEAHDREEAERERATGVTRIKIVPVQVAGNVPPLSTGMLLAAIAAPAGSDLAETYDPYPRWITELEDGPGADEGPAVYLFTNYIWSHEQNLDAARVIRERHPRALLVHGGPDCPDFPEDSERYLRANPQVDIAVRGEGEVTIVELLRALAPSIHDADGPDLDALRDVPGLAYLDGDEYVRTENRERMKDINVVPSPYLTGVFDVFGQTKQMGMAILETNRGCPYGCTFCNWGSATNSRIRKFDMDRILAEFEWCAIHEVPKIFMADANFGIFDRDVDIARHVVDLRSEHGFPHRFMSNYAKNTVKHLKQIVSILAEGAVLSEGLLSLQSMDTDTLAAIRRSNIKLEKYEALATEFRDSDMPLFVDLMIGLPGQTVDSFRSDLQQCVDREVNAKVHATELLVNSPMNEPEYRATLEVRSIRPPGPTGEGAEAASRKAPALVVSTSSFTRDDYIEMDQMRRSYLLLENLGVARLVARFVRHEVGLPEVDLYERMRLDASVAPVEWPFLRSTVLSVPSTMSPPTSWAFYRDELHRYLVDRIGVADDTALASILATMHAVLPAPARELPLRVELDHDVAAWYQGILTAKHAGHLHDWEDHVDRVGTRGPAVLTVSDPNDVCLRNLGVGTTLREYTDWELHSDVERAMPGHHRVV